MKTKLILFGLAAAVFSLACPITHAEPPSEPAGNKTLAPYFFVQSQDSSCDALPLKSTTVDVKVAGVIADVHITQVYSNAGGVPLEAIYVFPGSTRSAVYGMEMRVGERVLTLKSKSALRPAGPMKRRSLPGSGALCLNSIGRMFFR